MVICFNLNANMEIMDIVGRSDRSTHDSRIFCECWRTFFERVVYGDTILLGDGAYVSRIYIMTPLQECPTPEQLYNESQIRTRNAVERCFGIWKLCFPTMVLGLRIKLENTFPIIRATAILHNIVRRAKEEVPSDFEVALPTPWEKILAQDNVNIKHPGNHPQYKVTRDNRERKVLIEYYFER